MRSSSAGDELRALEVGSMTPLQRQRASSRPDSDLWDVPFPLPLAAAAGDDGIRWPQ